MQPAPPPPLAAVEPPGVLEHALAPATRPDPCVQEPLHIATDLAIGATATASTTAEGYPPGNAIDGNADTRWSTGHGMQPGDWFQVDLGASRTFDQVVLDTSGSPGDFVRQYQVFVSADGVDWGSPIATGPGGTVTRILVPPVTSRYVRIVNQGSSGSWWSIHELNILAPDASTDATSDGTVLRQTATLFDGTALDVAYNPGTSAASFAVLWGDTSYTYQLPGGAAVVFTTRPAS